MKKLIFIILFFVFQLNTCYAYNPIYEGFILNRETIYNALNLSDEQFETIEKINSFYQPQYEKILIQLEKKSNELRVQKKMKWNFCQNLAKQHEINKLNHNFYTLYHKENREIKKILTHKQCTKLSAIERLQKSDSKKKDQRNCLYKHNPEMNTFGNPKINN